VIEDFKEKRLAQGVRTVLHRMMKLAERKMLITESPFRDVDFLDAEGGEDFGPLRYRKVTPPIRTLNDPRACEASIPHPFEEKGR
jgi:hypothetical protein